VSNWNVANGLTALRFVLVPLFGWLLLAGDGRGGWRLAAAGAFIAAIITDRLDGELARRHGLVTDVGKIADPIADKALIGTALVALSLLGELSWWVTVVVLVRELLITGLRFVVIRRAVLPAGRGGKAKTALQALAITLYLLPLPGWGPRVAMVVMAAAVALTVVTGLDYLVKLVRIMRGGPAPA
jgi:CDP-diacylglycerol--glycerol-3-phosphate 3-phosphatidyltransferase